METILIIDDSYFNISYLENILKKEYNIIYANDGEKGLEMAMTMHPSLILLDIEMPKINGFQVMEKLQSQSVTQQIPTIFLTGIDDNLTEERAFFCGAVDYIRKPFYGNVVSARVRTHINMFRYRRMLEKEMYIDVLTGVNTRKHCIDYIRTHWEKCIEEQMPFSLGIADIDFFKKINDTFGHLEGDRVLKVIAQTIKKAMPADNNYVARMGGEEFWLVITGENKNKTLEIMQNVCSTIRNEVYANELYDSNKNMMGDSAEAINVTVSIGGITVIPSKVDSVDYFMSIADKKLYEAKNNGRNQVAWI